MSRRPVPHVALAPEHLPLVLVGLPGAGKTTVARLLAARGARVVDAAGMKLMKPLHEPEAEEFRFRSPSHSSMPEPDAPLRIRPDRHLGDDYRAAASHPG